MEKIKDSDLYDTTENFGASCLQSQIETSKERVQELEITLETALQLLQELCEAIEEEEDLECLLPRVKEVLEENGY